MIGESEHFHFAGRKSTDFKISNVNVSEGLYSEEVVSQRSVNEVRVRGRSEPYFVDTEEEPKTIQVKFAFLEPWNEKLINDVIRWLDVDTYQPLFFEGNLDKVFYALPTDGINKIHNGLKEGYLTLNMRCNSGKTYSHIISTPMYEADILGGLNILEHTDFSDSKNIDDWVSWLDYALIGGKREIRDYDFLYINVTSDVEAGQNPRIRTPYRYRLEKGQGYSFSFIGFTSDWIHTDFTMAGIYVDGKIQDRFTFNKEIIDLVTFNDLEKPLYRYTCTFQYTGESDDDCALFIGSESLNGRGAYIMFSQPKLHRGNRLIPYDVDDAIIKIANRGHYSIFPDIWIEKISDGDITIYNRTNNNEKFELKNIEIGEKLFIDCKNELIFTDKERTNRYGDFNDNYLELIYGENILAISNNVHIRFRYNHIFS